MADDRKMSDSHRADSSQILARLDARWNKGHVQPELEELKCLASQLSGDDQQRLDFTAELVMLDITNRWRRRGGRQFDPNRATDTDSTADWIPSEMAAMPKVDDYLKVLPELQHSDVHLLEVVEHEFAMRRRWGDCPTRDDFERSYAHLVDRATFEQGTHCGSSYNDETQAPDSIPVGRWSSSAPDGTPMNRHTAFLSRLAPFSDMPLSVTNSIAGRMQTVEFDQGQKLLEQGGTGDRLIVIRSGDVEIRLTNDQQKDRIIDRDGAGAVLGEMALLTGRPNSADVVAVSPVRALALPYFEFQAVTQEYPTLGVGFAHLIAKRLGRDEVDAFYDKTINGFRIQCGLGRGAMAVVYQAQQVDTGQIVALKMMKHPLAYSSESVKRFFQEADIVRSLNSENIIRVLDIFEGYGTFFIVMELCDGQTLGTLIQRSHPLPKAKIKAILGQLARGLAIAHEHNIVHRDLKPGNVLISQDNIVKLSDFGLARSLAADGELTVRGEILGTPRYMPPEQLLGSPVDYRADIYSFGCLAYEMIVGKPLFEEPNAISLLKRQLAWNLSESAELQRVPASSLDDDLVQLLRESLAHEADDRVLDLNRIAAWQ